MEPLELLGLELLQLVALGPLGSLRLVLQQIQQQLRQKIRHASRFVRPFVLAVSPAVCWFV